MTILRFSFILSAVFIIFLTPLDHTQCKYYQRHTRIMCKGDKNYTKDNYA